MTTNPSDKNSTGVCERIFKAFSPTSRGAGRASHRPQNSNDTKAATGGGAPHEKVIPIHSDSPVSNPTTEKEKANKQHAGHAHDAVKVASKKEPDQPNLLLQERPNHKPDHAQATADPNHKFSDYINRAKKKIRATTSHVGDGRTSGKSTAVRHDSFNDRVANYIVRAKMKIRTTTNMGSGIASEESRGP